MTLTSDPHAWLRASFGNLRAQPGFRTLAPSHQFEQLLGMVAADHPAKAAEMHEWSTGAKYALLTHLASMLDQRQSGRDEPLWRVHKGERTLFCVAYYLPSGIDLRLFEGEEFRRTQLCRDAPEVNILAREWRATLHDNDWLDEE